MISRMIAVCMALALLVPCAALAQDAEPAAPAGNGPDRAEISYALGVLLGSQLKSAYELDLAEVSRGVTDALTSDNPPLSQQELQAAHMAYRQKIQEAVVELGNALRPAGLKILEENGQREGVVVTESGLQYEVIEEGTGAAPNVESVVSVHYEGRFANGDVFDSSYERGEPAQFQVKGVIPGWTEALLLMKQGAKHRLWIPGGLAYGPQGRGEIPPDTMLIFDVELLDVQ
jgi:FKBP-type peptidyl-prolyl cis-trans isomerase FklB